MRSGIFVLIVCIENPLTREISRGASIKITATVMPIAATRPCNNAWRTGSEPAGPADSIRTRPRQNHKPGRRGGLEGSASRMEIVDPQKVLTFWFAAVCRAD